RTFALPNDGGNRMPPVDRERSQFMAERMRTGHHHPAALGEGAIQVGNTVVKGDAVRNSGFDESPVEDRRGPAQPAAEPAKVAIQHFRGWLYSRKPEICCQARAQWRLRTGPTEQVAEVQDAIEAEKSGEL